ncbi:hypothetical protein FKP32DRAFT_1605217 [Trametes sanguinea]|nr:hypothetical protein FKP32DRAFT_1605217 [Trametes sanguinea]
MPAEPSQDCLTAQKRKPADSGDVTNDSAAESQSLPVSPMSSRSITPGVGGFLNPFRGVVESRVVLTGPNIADSKEKQILSLKRQLQPTFAAMTATAAGAVKAVGPGRKLWRQRCYWSIQQSGVAGYCGSEEQLTSKVSKHDATIEEQGHTLQAALGGAGNAAELVQTLSMHRSALKEVVAALALGLDPETDQDEASKKKRTRKNVLQGCLLLLMGVLNTEDLPQLLSDGVYWQDIYSGGGDNQIIDVTLLHPNWEHSWAQNKRGWLPNDIQLIKAHRPQYSKAPKELFKKKGEGKKQEETKAANKMTTCWRTTNKALESLDAYVFAAHQAAKLSGRRNTYTERWRGSSRPVDKTKLLTIHQKSGVLISRLMIYSEWLETEADQRYNDHAYIADEGEVRQNADRATERGEDDGEDAIDEEIYMGSDGYEAGDAGGNTAGRDGDTENEEFRDVEAV